MSTISQRGMLARMGWALGGGLLARGTYAAGNTTQPPNIDDFDTLVSEPADVKVSIGVSAAGMVSLCILSIFLSVLAVSYLRYTPSIKSNN